MRGEGTDGSLWAAPDVFFLLLFLVILLRNLLPFSVFTLNLEVCHRVRCLLNVLLNVKQTLDFVFVA